MRAKFIQYFSKFLRTTISTGTGITLEWPNVTGNGSPTEVPDAQAAALSFCQQALAVFEEALHGTNGFDEAKFLERLGRVHESYVRDLPPGTKRLQELNLEALARFDELFLG